MKFTEKVVWYIIEESCFCFLSREGKRHICNKIAIQRKQDIALNRTMTLNKQMNQKYDKNVTIVEVIKKKYFNFVA